MIKFRGGICPKHAKNRHMCMLWGVICRGSLIKSMLMCMACYMGIMTRQAYDRVGKAAVHAQLALPTPLELRVSLPSGWCWAAHMHEGYAKALDQRVSASKQLLLVQAVWTLIHVGLRLWHSGFAPQQS